MRWGKIRRQWFLLLAIAMPVTAVALIDHSSRAPADAVAPKAYVFPIPGGRLAAPSTQITFRGVPANQLGSIQVSGSQSGNHTGHVAPDSDGNGGSFIPDSQFAAGETITVTAPSLNIEGTGHSSYRFSVANPAPPFATLPRPSAHRVRGDVWRYRSYPSIAPPAVKLVSRSGHTAAGDIFLAPWRGPVQYGPEILDASGNLVWFKAVSAPNWISDVRVQRYQGRPVLTWWQGPVNAASGSGQGVINDSSY